MFERLKDNVMLEVIFKYIILLLLFACVVGLFASGVLFLKGEMSENFKFGAEICLKIAKLNGCKKAILKARSPSCGSGQIYDGSFSKKLIFGDGVAAKLLKENGILVFSEDEIGRLDV